MIYRFAQHKTNWELRQVRKIVPAHDSSHISVYRQWNVDYLFCYLHLQLSSYVGYKRMLVVLLTVLNIYKLAVLVDNLVFAKLLHSDKMRSRSLQRDSSLPCWRLVSVLPWYVGKQIENYFWEQNRSETKYEYSFFIKSYSFLNLLKTRYKFVSIISIFEEMWSEKNMFQ